MPVNIHNNVTDRIKLAVDYIISLQILRKQINIQYHTFLDNLLESHSKINNTIGL